MMQNINVNIIAPPEGAAPMLEQMDEYSRENIGQSTYRFVRRMMRNPELRKLIQERAAEIRAANS